jgi:hypothetical protein
VHIGAVNQTASDIIEHVWKSDLRLTFIGSRIPAGTRVTLQTTTEDFFATAPPRYPTNCSSIRPLVGDATPVLLNVSTRHYRHRLCNGTCDEATFYLSKATPLVRGARYSLCFFIPLPFKVPTAAREYAMNLLPNVFIEVVQARAEYLQDVCTRYQNGVDLFMGSAIRDDTQRDIVRPYYFDSRHAAN